MANYQVEYFNVNKYGYQEDHPREIHWFQRHGLSRRDITNMLLACTQNDSSVNGHIYRNGHYIGMVKVEINESYKMTCVIIDTRRWFKFQWRAA